MNLPHHADKDRQIVRSLISQLQLLDDYETVIAEHNRLVREIDVILNGEDGAAKQASLCDLVEEIRELRVQSTELDRLNLEIARLAEEERAAAEMPAYISPSPKWEEDPWPYEGSWCGRYTRVAQSEANGEPEQIVDVDEVKAPREGLHPEMIDGMWRWVEDKST